MADEPSIQPEYASAIKALVTFVVGTGGILFLFGPGWAGVIAMAVLVLMITAIRQMQLGGDGGRPESLPPTGSECPHCGSFQTGYESKFADDGTEYEQLHCYSCDRDLQLDEVRKLIRDAD